MPPFYELPQRIKAWAQELGFADAGIAELSLDADRDHLQRWLDEGLHGQMAFMGRDLDKRVHPEGLRPGTLSVISLRLDYRPQAEAAQAVLDDGERAYISRYALGRDYHKLMRGRLLKLGARLEQAVGPHGYRVLTDSAPALEKALARNARLGWIGKNTLLLNRKAGSWFFLGEIYTDLPLPANAQAPSSNHCGSCSACLDVCPTKAFVAPYRLDARKCISYLTIEHRGAFPLELRAAIGNRVFGCDDCQLVCPWNRYAQPTAEADFAPRHGLDTAKLVELFGWDEATWLRKTEGMALRRLDHARWLRNLAIGLGNAPRSNEVLSALRARAEHPDEAVREHVRWALEQQGAG
ncbi:tRNA epoxyqueuosine(34) reductase QueG [Stagnimonas aquatica]|uniref:Epoxyqueuosine reductase n=1 Tax=Stagnimonas aquatica TaxID=2689987 RepID=A0A3N0V5C0_9GAMM|nr:tRNA epoxyqueuosine(34) reductase QueG [Stagnimonas aquatica]ROH87875.1 tRNA epoxyqueuosine(34) reductase QueG [Stagnimonas aquatica]